MNRRRLLLWTIPLLLVPSLLLTISLQRGLEGRKRAGWLATHLADRQVKDIVFDAQHRAWAATNNGVSVFDGDGWTPYNAESDGLVKIVSAPRVMTQDNLQAMIQSGVQIPVQTTANNTTTVQYIDATLKLLVTPQITAEGSIVMKIDVQKREPLTGLNIAGGQNAPLSTRQAQTQVMVRDGGTTVLGGIYQITNNLSLNRVPFLHRIPILGNLFKNKSDEKRHDELLIFISPRIVKNI